MFHLSNKLYEHTFVTVKTNLDFSEWAPVFVDAKINPPLLDRVTHRCRVLETSNFAHGFSAMTPDSFAVRVCPPNLANKGFYNMPQRFLAGLT